jgi:hypothetical protein
MQDTSSPRRIAGICAKNRRQQQKIRGAVARIDPTVRPSGVARAASGAVNILGEVEPDDHSQI